MNKGTSNTQSGRSKPTSTAATTTSKKSTSTKTGAASKSKAAAPKPKINAKEKKNEKKTSKTVEAETQPLTTTAERPVAEMSCDIIRLLRMLFFNFSKFIASVCLLRWCRVGFGVCFVKGLVRWRNGSSLHYDIALCLPRALSPSLSNVTLSAGEPFHLVGKANKRRTIRIKF